MFRNVSRQLIVIFLVNILNLIGFGIYYISKLNYEFVIYLAVVLGASLFIAISRRWIRYPFFVLWGLTVWAILHMAGGAFYFNGTRLYDVIFINMSSKLPILRYDQIVHMWGYGISTIFCFYLLLPFLKPSRYDIRLWIVVMMAGLGVGAVNEILEFFVVLLVPESGVGDYVNTSLDLIADLIGATLAGIGMSVKNNRQDNSPDVHRDLRQLKLFCNTQ